VVGIGAVPGSYNATCGLWVCSGTGRVAAIRESEKGKDGEVVRVADGTAPVVVGPWIKSASRSALDN
jgi:hypothetical protein